MQKKVKNAPRAFFGVRPLLCRYWKSPNKRIVEHHCHWHSELLLLTCGTYEYEVKGQKYAAHAGDCVLYPPRIAHSEANPPDDPPQFYHIKFVWQNIFARLPLQVYDRDGKLKLLTTWLYESYWAGISFSYECSCSLLASVLGEFVRLSVKPEPPLVKTIRTFILENLSSNITLEKMASHIHLNKYYFARLYKSLTGVSPVQEVRQIRLSHARNLILSSSKPLKAIAAETGFSSESSLSHAMQKYEHISPSQLKNQTKRGY